MDEAIPKTMDWQHGKPCTTCGKPTVNRRNEFEGGGRSWFYYAPLYHSVENGTGFCGAECSWEWAKAHVYQNLGDR